jgi:hypothetical protein
MTAPEFLSRLHSVTKTGRGWSARCPAHEDQRASLSVDNGEKGLVIHCHAGCSPEAICGAVGLRVGDLFTTNGNGKAAPRLAVATYDYKSADGNLLFQVVRFEPKDFRQRRPNGKGGWLPNIEGVERVLFRLPELLNEMRDLPVYVVEGEKDALAMAKNGFAATTNPGGAGKWRPELSKTLRGAQVVIIADKDLAGRKHAEQVARSLHGVARSVQVLELPDVCERPVKDAADYFAAGGGAAELDDLARLAPIWAPPRSGQVEEYLPTEKESPAEAAPAAADWRQLVTDGAAIMEKKLPPVVEVVKGLLVERTKFMIASSSKSYKTWLTIDLGLSIAHGLPWLGRETTQSRVLYANFELRPEAFERRLQTVAAEKRITFPKGWFFHLPLRGFLAGLKPGEVMSRLIRIMRDLGTTVFVLDPLFKLNAGRQENDAGDQTLLFNEIDRLTTEAKSTVILNDHFGKGLQSDKDPLDAIRGSSAKGGDVDAAMVLRKHEVEDSYRADVLHRELPPVEPFCLGWKFPLMELREDLDPDAMKKCFGGRQKQYDPRDFLTALTNTSTTSPISVSAWAKAADVPRQTLQEYLPQMRAKGWIETVGEGNSARKYLTKSGRAELESHRK